MDKEEIKKGTHVRTTKDAGRDDWAFGRNDVKWGVHGTVLRHSNSHGLCFLILHHTDGTEAWYDVEEVEVLESLESQEPQPTIDFVEEEWGDVLRQLGEEKRYVLMGPGDNLYYAKGGFRLIEGNPIEWLQKHAHEDCKELGLPEITQSDTTLAEGEKKKYKPSGQALANHLNDYVPCGRCEESGCVCMHPQRSYFNDDCPDGLGDCDSGCQWSEECPYCDGEGGFHPKEKPDKELIDAWKDVLLHSHCKHTRCDRCSMNEKCKELGRPILESPSPSEPPAETESIWKGCKHKFYDVISSIGDHSSIQWCKDCGAYRAVYNGDYSEWRIPYFTEIGKPSAKRGE